MKLHKQPGVKDLIENCESLSGYELSDKISRLSTKDQVRVLTSIPPNCAADAIITLYPRSRKKILLSMPIEKTSSILLAMRPDDRTAFLELLPRNRIDEFVKLLPNKERILTLTLLGYPENSVGRLMTTDYIAVKMDYTAEQVLDHIRAYGHDSETISMIYVVDDQDVLLDDINIRDFLFVPKDYKVSQIADGKFIALNVLETAEQAIRIFKQHRRTALPVIDDDGLMLGIVTMDDMFRLASRFNTEDFQKIGGTEALDEPYMKIALLNLINKRAHWLVLLFLGEMFTATAMGYFEAEISKAVVLALFLPLIISSGGNAGSQSSTLIIRAMALGEVHLKDWWRIMNKEIITGFSLGVILGIVGFARVSVWSMFTDLYGPHWILIAITIFFALICVVLWGSLVGSMLPFILRGCKFDPATSSAPLVATLVDVTGIVLYFLIALVILKGTLL